MTRSELLESAIETERYNLEFLKLHNKLESRDVQFTLDILLAEQKRSEGCEYCNGDALYGYVLENVNGKYPKILTRLAVANGHGTNQHVFEFCPNCGRDLTEGESV